MPEILSPERLEALFTSSGGFRFARWGRPIVPVIFGAADESLPVLKGGIEAVVALAGHKMAETDFEIGANLMVFFLRDWDELAGLPEIEKLVPGVLQAAPELARRGAWQYRQFRHDPDGAIRACMVFLNMSGPLGETPAEELALGLAVSAILLWGEGVFAQWPPLLPGPDGPILRPELAALLRAAYDPVLPSVSNDPVLALRLAARL